MSIINSSTKFVGINPNFPTAERKSAQNNAAQEVVTMQDIIDTVDESLTAPTLQSVTDQGKTTTNEIQFGTGVGILLDNGSRLQEGTIDAQTGGSKGIAQICAVGYELKWEAGSQYVMDGNGTLIREVNHKFNIIPNSFDDRDHGYYVGSRWILDNGDIWVCIDHTPQNAVWEIVVNADWNATTGSSAIANKPTVDSVPTDDSANAVSSNGVFDALALKAPLMPRVQSLTSSETVTPTSTNDFVKITAQSVGLTLANPTGTFDEGKDLIIRIKDNGTARSIAYGTKYRAIGVTLPTTTVLSKTTYLGIIYNSTDDTFDVIGVTTQA